MVTVTSPLVLFLIGVVFTANDHWFNAAQTVGVILIVFATIYAIAEALDEFSSDKNPTKPKRL